MSKTVRHKGAFMNAYNVLQAAAPAEKLTACKALHAAWMNDKHCGKPPEHVPTSPARPQFPKLVPPTQVPRRRLGSEAGRIALLHSVAHIELNAIDLAADMICRFGPDIDQNAKIQIDFITDWISVANDEARHFEMINARLVQMGAQYGDLPAHNGLWEAAVKTSGDVGARLAIAPLVLEARGLDVTPPLITKLDGQGDKASANILRIIYEEEIHHVAIGVKWFNFVTKSRGENPEKMFQNYVSRYFSGGLKPPFNVNARQNAGLPASFYTIKSVI